MALDTKQIADLNALNKKISGGYSPTATDTANLNYAISKGYKYNPLPQGATKIAGPSGLQGLTEKDIFRQGQDIFKLPKVDTTVNTEETIPTVPEPEEAPDVISSLMEGVKTSNKGLQSILEAQQAPLPSEERKTETMKEIERATADQRTDQRDLQETERERFGLSKNVEQLQAIMPQIARLQSEFEKDALRLQETPGRARIIGGTQDRLQRQRAIELAGLSAVAQAYQGNVDMARSIAQESINAQYQDIQNYNNNLQTQLTDVYQDLNQEQKIKADQLNQVIIERNRQIEEEKLKETNISNIMVSVAQAGASQDVINKIMKSDDYLKAIQIASPYLGSGAGDWSESEITDADGNPMLFNKSTGEYKTSIGTSTSDIYFTDANGDSWNIAGWATDQTKPRQMDTIAKRIGKVTEENINEKVKEFTPGLTADMIKEASAMSGVSWEAIMTMVVQESTGGTSPVAKKNNNFGGLTFNNQEWIKQFGGVKGTERPTAEGGNYIKFPTKQDGLNAMSALMASYGKIEDSTPTVDPEITSYSKMVANGDLTEIQALQQISDSKKPELVQALAGIVSPNDTTQDILAKEKATMALNLKNHRGLKNAVGTISLGRQAPFQWGQKADFINSVEQLVSDLSLESLIQAKSRGATFGALSDTEMKILASAATTIGNMRVYDKSGNVKGYRSTEGRFKEELDKISKTFLRGIKGNIENMDITSETMTSTPIISGTTSSGINYKITE
jgi:hypothetical protein